MTDLKRFDVFFKRLCDEVNELGEVKGLKKMLEAALVPLPPFAPMVYLATELWPTPG